MTIKRRVFRICVIFWMILIFCFSAQDGHESQKDSYQAGMLAGRLFVPGFEKWSAEKQQIFSEKIDHPIRKTAHATEYAVLGILIFVAYIEDKKSRISIFIPWILATCYAATDELHQLFVPGRSGRITDVMIDSAGALVGIMIAFVVLRLRDKSS